jgi:predicted nucleotidyltransferase
MTAPLLNISGKIDPALVEPCATVADCAAQLQVPYLVVGASARDWVLHYGYGAAIQRATSDIDFALQVPSWDSFTALKRKLIENNFSKTNTEHRLIAPNQWPIDIVPFGGVADENTNIQWPPSGDFVMNVLGFQEALDGANIVRISDAPILDIPVASPVGMMILKLIAWLDRDAQTRKKDAKDIAYFLTTYETIPATLEQLYQEQTLMELYAWDITLAAAYQLGIDARKIALSKTYCLIADFLNNQNKKLSLERLLNEMGVNRNSPYARKEMILNAFKRGFLS